MLPKARLRGLFNYVHSIGHATTHHPPLPVVYRTEGRESRFRGIVTHFSHCTRKHLVVLVERSHASVKGQERHLYHLVWLLDELRCVAVVYLGRVYARLNAAMPYLQGVLRLPIPMLIGKRDKDAVRGVLHYPSGVVYGDGVGLPDNANQSVSRLYQRHRVCRMDNHRIGKRQLLAMRISSIVADDAAKHSAHNHQEQRTD